jgi:hypothetical protein
VGLEFTQDGQALKKTPRQFQKHKSASPAPAFHPFHGDGSLRKA